MMNFILEKMLMELLMLPFLLFLLFARVDVHFAHDGLNVTILSFNKIVLFFDNVSIDFAFMY